MSTGWRRSTRCGGGECVEVAGNWRRSTRCGGGDCVEVAQAPRPPGDIVIRDSADPTGPILMFPRQAFVDFTDAVKAGEFDNLAARTAPANA